MSVLYLASVSPGIPTALGIKPQLKWGWGRFLTIYLELSPLAPLALASLLSDSPGLAKLFVVQSCRFVSCYC
jgi:hypothetical protein